jgi:osmoprotectant transport system substrate-binding protein
VLTKRLPLIAVLLACLTVALGACTDSDDGDDVETGGGSAEPTQATFTFRPQADAGGPATREALERGEIDIAVLFSSDGTIAANNWVALEDDKNLQPVDNFIPAIRNDANNEQVAAVLNAISAALTTEDMQEMVAKVGIDGEDPEDVALAYLEEKNLPGDLTASGEITVGSSNFPESTITAELYANALEAAGMSVEKQLDIGAREAYLPALERGDIDLIPEFVGTLLTVLEGEPTTDLDETVEAARALTEEKGYTLLEASEADSVNTFVVTQETAEKYNLAKVSDLATVEDELVLGGPAECPEREPCLIGLKDTYGLKFAE